MKVLQARNESTKSWRSSCPTTQNSTMTKSSLVRNDLVEKWTQNNNGKKDSQVVQKKNTWLAIPLQWRTKLSKTQLENELT